MNGNFTARKRSLWQGNVFTPVCQSFCSQGEEHPPRSTPPRQTPPPGQKPQGRPPLPDTPLGRHHPRPPRQTPPSPDTLPPPPQTATEAGGTHPTGIHYCLMTVLLLNFHSAVQTRTQMQTEPEVFRKYRQMC